MTPEEQELEEFFKKIGKRLGDLRKKAGYSNQEAFAHKVGIARAQYSRYEVGVNITIETLYKILSFYKMSFEEFFKEGF